MNPDGTDTETILILGKDEWMLSARESPDGTRLAFDLSRGRDATAHSEAWVVSAEGHRHKIADDGYVAAWSPDGTRLATHRSDSSGRVIENFILEVETGKASLLPFPKSDVVWDWSPDGQFLALMAGNPGKVFEHPTKGTYPLRQIYLAKPDGSGRELVTTGPMLDSIAACFSPDGTRLAYEERRHHDGRVLHFGVVQSLPHGEPKDLVEFTKLYEGNFERRPHGSPRWTPDGKSIVWLVPRRKVQSADIHPELVIVALDTGKIDRLDLFERGLDWVQAIDWR
jgi:Tol biopolymer transport system component